MAVELAQGLEQSFGLQLPVMMLNESPSVESVTSFIVEKLLNTQVDESVNSTETLVKDLARQHGENFAASDIKQLVEEKEGHELMDRSVVI